jgi:hypothetical protein
MAAPVLDELHHMHHTRPLLAAWGTAAGIRYAPPGISRACSVLLLAHVALPNGALWFAPRRLGRVVLARAAVETAATV